MIKYLITIKYVLSTLVAGVILAGGLVSPVAYAVDTATTEGQQMVFKVTLGGAPNGWAVRYQYSTSDSSAVKGQDYKAVSGKVTFPSGVKEQKIYVDTLEDTKIEGSEVFKLNLYDQEVNGLYRGVAGWVESTIAIRQMPGTVSFTGQILDNDSAAVNAAKRRILCTLRPWIC